MPESECHSKAREMASRPGSRVWHQGKCRLSCLWSHRKLQHDFKVACMQDTSPATVHKLVRPDGLELHVLRYDVPATTQVKGLVVLVHGFSWHSGYFQPLAERLTNQGLAVVAYDLRGHGHSGLVDGIRGFAHSFDDHVDDLQAVLDYARGIYTGAHHALPHALRRQFKRRCR